MHAARDVARITFVFLSNVEDLHASVLHQPLEIGDVDRLDPLCRLDVGDEGVELEEADRAQAASRPLGLVL